MLVPLEISPLEGLKILINVTSAVNPISMVLDTGASAVWARSSLLSKDQYDSTHTFAEITYAAGKIQGEIFEVPISIGDGEKSVEKILIVDSVPLWWSHRAMIGLSRGPVQPLCPPIWQNLTKATSFTLALPLNSKSGSITFGKPNPELKPFFRAPLIRRSPEWACWIETVELLIKDSSETEATCLASYCIPKEKLDSEEKESGWTLVRPRGSTLLLPSTDEDVAQGASSMMKMSKVVSGDIKPPRTSLLSSSFGFVDLGSVHDELSERAEEFDGLGEEEVALESEEFDFVEPTSPPRRDFTKSHNTDDVSSKFGKVVFDCGHAGTALAMPASSLQTLSDVLVNKGCAVWSKDKFGRKQLKVLQDHDVIKKCKLRFVCQKNSYATSFNDGAATSESCYEIDLMRVIKRSLTNLPSTLNITPTRSEKEEIAVMMSVQREEQNKQVQQKRDSDSSKNLMMTPPRNKPCAVIEPNSSPNAAFGIKASAACDYSPEKNEEEDAQLWIFGQKLLEGCQSSFVEEDYGCEIILSDL